MAQSRAGTSKSSEQHLNAFLDRVLTTADRTVFEHIDLGLNHNAEYDQPELLELLAHCGIADEFANGGAKTRRVATGDLTGLRNDRRSPSAKALGYHLRGLDRGEISEQFETVLDELLRLGEKARLFTRSVDIAIDVHDWLFYGDEETEMVANTNPSQGTATAYKFVTACVVVEGLRLTLAVVPLPAKEQLPDAVDAVIRRACDWIDIRRVFLDRGFYRVSVLQVLQAHDVRYVMRAPAFRQWVDEQSEIQLETDYRTTQSNPPYEWVEHTRFAVPHAQSPDEKHTFFVTNCTLTEKTVTGLAEAYRRRWGVETSYRVIGDFLAKSRSTAYSVRLFYFLFAVTLYNLWVLCNRLLSTVFEWDLDLPPISAAVFGRLVRDRWMADLFDPG